MKLRNKKKTYGTGAVAQQANRLPARTGIPYRQSTHTGNGSCPCCFISVPALYVWPRKVINLYVFLFSNNNT